MIIDGDKILVGTKEFERLVLKYPESFPMEFDWIELRKYSHPSCNLRYDYEIDEILEQVINGYITRSEYEVLEKKIFNKCYNRQ